MPRDLAQLRMTVEQCALQGDREGVLLVLLTAWAQHRSPALASVIEACARPFQGDLPLCEDHESWRELARCREPRVLGVLLASPWYGSTLEELSDKISLLEGFEPDPRVASFVGKLLRKVAWGPAGLAKAEEVLAFHGLPDPPPPDDPGLEALLAASALRPDPREHALLQGIFDAPEDDRMRLVYADLLMERGDPIGDYLMSELDPKAERAGLGSRRRRRWCRYLLGPVDDWQVELRRGFPYRVSLPPHASLRLPHRWATLQIMHWFPQQKCLPQLERLARAKGPRAFHLEAGNEPLSERAWVQQMFSLLEALELRELVLPLSMWSPTPFSGGRWPALQRLGFWDPTALRLDESLLGDLAHRPLEIELWSSSHWLERMVSVGFLASRTAAPSIARITTRCRSNLTSSHFFSFNERESCYIVLEREGGALRHLRLVFPSASDILDPRQIEGIPEDSIDRITVETELHSDPDPDHVQRIREALRRFQSVPIDIRPPTTPP